MARAKLTKKRKWALFGVFAALVVLTGAIVLMATYLPIKPAEVYSAMYTEVEQTFSQSGENRLWMSEYSKIALSELKKNNLSYANELESYNNISSGMENLFDFYSFALPQTLSGNIERKQLKAINANIAEGRAALNGITNYLKNNLEKMIANGSPIYTVIEAGWKSMRENYAKALISYSKALDGLTNIYNLDSAKGIYGNPMGVIVAKSSAQFLEATHNFFFEKDNYELGINLAETFKTFTEYVKFSLNGNANIVEAYYINQDIQILSGLILKANSEGRYSTKLIIDNGLSLDGLNLDETEQGSANKVLQFLNGGLSI